jgi:hypothetical protein
MQLAMWAALWAAAQLMPVHRLQHLLHQQVQHLLLPPQHQGQLAVLAVVKLSTCGAYVIQSGCSGCLLYQQVSWQHCRHQVQHLLLPPSLLAAHLHSWQHCRHHV